MKKTLTILLIILPSLVFSQTRYQMVQKKCMNGEFYNETGNYPMAKQAFKEALSMDSTCVRALENLGYIYCKLEQYDSAKTFFEKQVKYDPGQYYGYLNLARWYFYADKLDSAIFYYSQSISVKPSCA